MASRLLTRADGRNTSGRGSAELENYTAEPAMDACRKGWGGVTARLTKRKNADNLKKIAKPTMSAEQLSALLADLKDNETLRDQLKGATDLDSAQAIVNRAGFDVSKEEWLAYQAQQTSELNDTELDKVAGGFININLNFNLDGTYMCINSPES
jgi:predicted ribosomally synthesized peptide with nif11-like leader